MSVSILQSYCILVSSNAMIKLLLLFLSTFLSNHMKLDTDRKYHFNRMNDATNQEYDKKIKQLWEKPYQYDGL